MQGDIKTASSDTYMALNGSGFFVVEQKIGQNDGNAVFGGTSYYTRRGDFDVDKEGYLVNGAGYYLKGLPINQTTGNISGSVPEVIQISNSFLPAQQTTRVDYQLNLPQLPKTASYDHQTPQQRTDGPANSCRSPADTAADQRPAPTARRQPTAASTIAGAGDTFTITIDATTRTYAFTMAVRRHGNADDRHHRASIDTVAEVLTADRDQSADRGRHGRDRRPQWRQYRDHARQRDRLSFRSRTPRTAFGDMQPARAIATRFHRARSGGARADDHRRRVRHLHLPVDRRRRHHGLCLERRAGERAAALGQRSTAPHAAAPIPGGSIISRQFNAVGLR